MKFIYLHIPKCGGSSLHHTLAHRFGNNYTRLKATERGRGGWNVNAFNEYVKRYKKDKFGGHIRYEIIKDRTDYNLFTFIRHPVERMISHYYYFSKHSGLGFWNGIHHNVKGDISLLEFAEQEKNYQYRYLGGGINKYFFIGVVEYYKLSLGRLGNALGVGRLKEFHTNNWIPKNPIIIDESTREEIKRINKIDMDLYDSIIGENYGSKMEARP